MAQTQALLATVDYHIEGAINSGISAIEINPIDDGGAYLRIKDDGAEGDELRVAITFTHKEAMDVAIAITKAATKLPEAPKEQFDFWENPTRPF